MISPFLRVTNPRCAKVRLSCRVTLIPTFNYSDTNEFVVNLNVAYSSTKTRLRATSVTCHMGSHSLICHPTQVNAPHLVTGFAASTVWIPEISMWHLRFMVCVCDFPMTIADFPQEKSAFCHRPLSHLQHKRQYNWPLIFEITKPCRSTHSSHPSWVHLAILIYLAWLSLPG